MTHRLYIDIETRSRIDLKKSNVYRYTQCPDFKILMAWWALDDGPLQVALTPEEMWAIPGLWDADADLVRVAHNAPFERVCFSVFSGLPLGTYLPADQWRDTLALAQEAGYPAKLETLAKALGAPDKDTAGTRLINLFSKPRRDGGWNDATTHPVEWMDFLLYGEQDVVTLREVDRMLPNWPTRTEKDIYLADQAVNDRGIRIDTDVARAAVAAAHTNQAEQKTRFKAITGVDNPSSVQQVGKWLQGQGLDAPNLQAATVEGLLAGDLTDTQREALELRQELALVASKKFSSALGSVNSDSRLRGTLAFHGAHTGRWAGRGTQLQNLPRSSFANVADTELVIADLLAGERVSAEDLKRLVRPLFVGPFVVVDYASIEARVVAWLAGEQWALDAFNLGRDIYVETAQRMSTPDRPLTRSQGKVAVLALGYNGGTNSLRAMGADGEENELKSLVVQWRRANPRIVRLWQQLGDAFSEPAQVGQYLRMTESTDNLGRAVTMHLPSGRSLTYHDCRWERYKVQDAKTGRWQVKEGWRHANPKDPHNPKMRLGTYGGKLTENATQAVARDVMGEALVRLEAAGYPVVGHIHDEILVEGDHDVQTISTIMTQVPAWAKGMPIAAAGFKTYRYRKG